MKTRPMNPYKWLESSLILAVFMTVIGSSTTAHSQDVSTSEVGTQMWAFMTGNSVVSSPALGTDGTIYVGSDDGNLYAINPDGTQMWAFTTGDFVESSPAIGTDGTVYVGSRDASLYAINPDGTQKWVFPTGDSVLSSPAIGTDGTLYVGSIDGNLYAINPDGTQKWAFMTGNSVLSSPALGTDGIVYVGSDDGNLYAINPDGTQKWAFMTGGRVASSPAIGEEGTLYVGSEDGALYAINPDGTQKWVFPTGLGVDSSPATGTVYVGSNDGGLYAINPDGTQKWAFMTGGMFVSSPAFGKDGTVYLGSNDGSLYAVNPDGTQKWVFPTGNGVLSSPAIGTDGTLYVGSSDGNLYAINGSSGGLSDSTWPMFRHDLQHTGQGVVQEMTKSGVLRDGVSLLDSSGNGRVDDCSTDQCLGSGLRTLVGLSEEVALTVEAHRFSVIPGKFDFIRFSFFDLPVINDSGQIAFMANYFKEGQVAQPGSPGIFPINALWTKKAGEPLTLLVEDGMEARSISADTYFANHRSFNIAPIEPGRPSSTWINNYGEIAFGYDLEDAENTDLPSAWLTNADGNLRPVVYTGMPKPGGGTFDGITYEFVNFGSIPLQRLNDNGQVAFRQSISGVQELWLESAACEPGSNTLDQLDISNIRNLTEFHITNFGSILVHDSENDAILRVNKNGSTTLVSKGEHLAGMESDETLSSIGLVAFNNKGSFAFTGVGSTNRYLYVYGSDGGKEIVKTVGRRDNPVYQPIFLLEDDRLVYGIREFVFPGYQWEKVWLGNTLIIQKGDPIPGSTTGATFFSIWPTGANNKGQVVFKTRRSVQNQGIYAWDGSGSLVKVIQSGDVIETAPGEEKEISSPQFNTTHASYSKRVINDDGKLVFRVYYDSGTTAIVSAQLAPVIDGTNGYRETGPSSANYASSGFALGNINTYTGEFVVGQTADLDLGGGPLPLFFGRYYASDLGTKANNGLGNNWSHNFWMTLTRARNAIRVITSDGRVVQFKRVEDSADPWELEFPLDIPYHLEESNNELIFADLNAKIRYVFVAKPCGPWQLSRVLDNNSNTLTLRYGSNDLLSEVSDGLGRKLSLAYDANDDHLVTVTDGTRTVTFGYDSAENLISYTDAEMDTTQYEYVSTRIDDGLLNEVVYPDGKRPAKLEYNEDGQVNKVTDSDGNYYTFSYSGSTTTVTSPADSNGASNSQRFAHNTDGELVVYTDEDNRSIRYSYNSRGALETITDRKPTPGITVYTYHDASGKVASITSPDKTKIKYEYSSVQVVDGIDFYNLTKTTFPDTTTESFVYDSAGNVIILTDQALNDWHYVHNSRGQVVQSTNPNFGTTIYAYNNDGTLLNVTDEERNTTTFHYDSLKRLRSTVNADSSKRNYTYDNRDAVRTVENENAQTTTLAYDDNANLKTITDPLFNERNYDFDTMGRLNRITDSLGNYSEFKFDEQSRVKEIIDRNNNKASFGYDALGRLNEVTHPGEEVWKATYDAEGAVSSITDPLSKTTNFATDSMGRITEITDHPGNKVKANYDSMGRVNELENPLGSKVKINYDERGLLSSLEFPEGIKPSYDRNNLGLITEVTDPNGNIWTRKYDPMGRLTSTTDPQGSSTAYQYDNRNRLNNVRYSNGDTLDVNYDGVGNIINLTYPGIEAIASIASIRAAQSKQNASDDCNDAREIKYIFSRDEKGHVLSDLNKTIDLKWDRQWLSLYDSVENRITNSNGLEIKYDAGGRITSITYPGNKIVTYEYGKFGNEKNRLLFVDDWTGGRTSFSYDKGRLQFLIKANNSLTSYQHYDSKHPLFEDIVDGLSDVTIEEASRVIKLTETAADAGAARIGASTMAYNKANKIIYEKSTGLMDGSATDLGFKFLGFPDVNDEREKLDILNYDKTNRLVGIGITGVEDLITYDSRGRVTQGKLSRDKRRKYCWDKASRLIEYFTINETTSNVEKQVSLSYDAFNRVIRRNETYSGGKLVENFTWNYALGVPRVSITADIDSGKTWYHIYTPKGDLLHSIREGDNAKYFYHFDLLGNTAFLSNEDGKIVERYGYSVYGKYGYEYEPRLEKIDYINRFTYKGMFGWMNEDPQELSHPGTGSQKASSLGVNFRPLYLTGQNYYDSFLYGNLKPSVINFIDAYQFNPYQMGRGSPSGWVRLGGLVRGVFGAIESIIGVAGAIVDPEPLTKVGFAALAAHGVDDAYTGWNSFTTGRFQVSGTERVVAAAWEAAGASPEVAAGAGAGFDFGWSMASGFAGPKALARSFRTRALLQGGELYGASRSLNILSNSSSGSLATIAGMDATVVESALALAVQTGDEIIFRGKTVWLLHNKSRGIITVVAHANPAELAGLSAPAFATGLRQALMARGITGVRGVHLTSCRSGCGLFGDFLATQLQVPVRASLGKTHLLIDRRVGVHQVLINGKWTDEAGGFVTKWPIIR